MTTQNTDLTLGLGLLLVEELGPCDCWVPIVKIDWWDEFEAAETVNDEKKRISTPVHLQLIANNQSWAKEQIQEAKKQPLPNFAEFAQRQLDAAGCKNQNPDTPVSDWILEIRRRIN